MKIVLGALALSLAMPAAAQTAPAANPHAGHGQHAGHSAMMGKDHAHMMLKCKDPKASATMKAHCAAMMKEPSKQGSAAPQPNGAHAH